MAQGVHRVACGLGIRACSEQSYEKWDATRLAERILILADGPRCQIGHCRHVLHRPCLDARRGQGHERWDASRFTNGVAIRLAPI